MATITTAAAGNWGATGTWTGGVLPGLSDTAKLTFPVTLDANYSVGGIDPTSSATLVGSNQAYRLLVGGTGVVYIAKAIVV